MSFINIHAQQNKNEFWSHVRFGGNLGFNFNNNYYSATVAPSAIYEFNHQFALGLGLNASFSGFKNNYESIILGGSIIGLYNPTSTIQLSSEFEQLNVNRNYNDPVFKDENYWLPALHLGLAYKTNYMALGIRYDVLYNKEKSIYINPWSPFVRVYF